jgi:crotonobetainyl-CoA:carnitine CoA-transferase CaiB-like acyl-CoA transferase
MQTVHHHNGDYKMATWPVRVDGRAVRLKGSPKLGGDSAEVLHNWLGIGAGEAESLRRDGII